MASKKRRGPSAAPPPPKPNAARAEHRQQQAQAKEQQRLAKERARRAAALRKRLIAAGLGLVLVGAVGAYLVNDRRQDAALNEALEAGGTCRADDESDPTRPAGQNHIPAPTFAVDPPAGGDHTAAVARSGAYAGEAVPEDGQLVHALEHGYVVVWHQGDLADDEKQQLQDFVEERAPDAILAERASLEVPVAATAWGQRLLCDGLELDALAAFHDAHVDNGPEDVDRT